MDMLAEQTHKKLKVFLIVPSYNEEENIPLFVQTAEKQLSDYQWKVLFINDGSTDGTWDVIQKMHERNSCVHGLCFSRNFGHQQALSAGLNEALADDPSDVYITMDADLQHPIEFIHDMIREYRKGVHIVQSLREDAGRNIPWLKKISSWGFYKIFSLLSGIDMNPGMSDFRLIDYQTLCFIAQCKEKDLFLRGLLPWSGLKMNALPYKPAERVHGTTKFTIKKMTDLAMSGIVGYSTRPLSIAALLGCVFIFLSLSYFIYVIVLIASGSEKVLVGWTSIIATVLALGGVQLFMLGIIGIYLGRFFMEHKQRPAYLIEKKV